MKLARRALLTAALAAPTLARAQEGASSLRDLARRAAIYLHPVQEMYRTRWNATVNELNSFRHRLNRFQHGDLPADERARPSSTMPNKDLLYSSAWLDLSADPMFLTLPPMGDLYYNYVLLDPFTNAVATVSRRLHGGMPRPRMIVGPKWQGDAANEVEVVRSPVNSLWLLGRILVDSPGDLQALRQIQTRALLEIPDMRNERRILESRELMRFRTVAPVEPVADWQAPNPADPFDLFETALRMLGESPLGERESTAFEEFAALRLRPGRKFDARAFTAPQRAAMESGIADGRAEIQGAAPRYTRTVAGWTYPETSTDRLFRAWRAETALAQLEPAEAIYIVANADVEGRPLDGANRYTLSLIADALPPARACWSLSLYEVSADGRATFLSALSDDDAKPSPGGLVEIRLQGHQADGNWLQTPTGPIRLVLRVYEPKPALLEGRYRLPGIKRI